MTTPVARRQAATGQHPPAWLLTALVDDDHAELSDLDTRNPASAAIAREYTASFLSGWGTPESSYDARLVISELVTNAMRHAGGVIRLKLVRRGEQLACAVTDSSAAGPVLTAHDYFSEGGRGLHLVAALSAHWGWFRLNEHSKLVWAVLNP